MSPEGGVVGVVGEDLEVPWLSRREELPRYDVSRNENVVNVPYLPGSGEESEKITIEGSSRNEI